MLRRFGAALVGAGLLVSGIAVAPATASTPSPVRYLTHGPRTAPVVALTFDDGWDAADSLAIANILLASHAPATFFPHGTALRESPGLWNWIAHQPGIAVGNHTASHLDLTTLSAQGQLNEIATERRLLDQTTGLSAARILRPPYGHVNPAALVAAAQAGYGVVVGWDVDSNDPFATPAQIYLNVMKTVQAGSVVLMHAGPSAEVQVLPGVIAAIRARGYAIAPLAQVLGVPVTNGAVENALPEAGADKASRLALPSALATLDPSVQIDARGALHVAYASSDGIWYATNRTGVLNLIKVISNGHAAFYGSPSLALDASGLPTVAYEGVSASSSWIGMGTLWQGYFPIRRPSLFAGHLTTPSLAIDRQGLWHIAFRASFTSSRNGLWRAIARCATCSWSVSRIDTSLVDIQPSIAVDRSNHELIAFRRSESASANGTYLVGAATNWRASRVSQAAYIPSLAFDKTNHIRLGLEEVSAPRVFTLAGLLGAWGRLTLATSDGIGSSVAVSASGKTILVVTKGDSGTARPVLWLEEP